MKRIIALALAFVMVLSLAACGGKTEALSVCIASEPDTIDPALNSSVDGATLVIHAFAGLAGYQQAGDGSLEIVADCAKELVEPTIGEDGKATYVLELKDDLKWSDGQPLTAKDFVFAWNRAASPALGADYGYMFDVIDGYAEMTAVNDDGSLVNPDAKLNVTASEDGKTLTVVTTGLFGYFNELLAFPAYMPVREDIVSNENWATSPETYIGNGPYVLSAWAHSSKMTYTKNEHYHNAEAVTMPSIEFYLSDDENAMLANYKNSSWQFIDNVPTAETANLKKDYPDEFKIEAQYGTYYVNFNINTELLPSGFSGNAAAAEQARQEIRSALGLLLDRNYIVNDVAQGGQLPASTFVASAMTDADGKTPFSSNAGSSDAYDGYFNTSADAYAANCEQAVETLKKYYDYDEATNKFTNVPTLEYIYNTDSVHAAIAEYIQSALASYGINVTLTNQEWNVFLNTRKDGNYAVARNGWLADYNDPISFLDMWISASGNNDAQFGKGAHAALAIYSLDLTPYGIDYKVENATWAQTYDRLITEIKACDDNVENRFAMMHIAEDMLMQTGCLCPIYYYTDVYMISQSVNGFFTSPLGFKYFMYTTISK